KKQLQKQKIGDIMISLHKQNIISTPLCIRQTWRNFDLQKMQIPTRVRLACTGFVCVAAFGICVFNA
ncbi:MAG: hypothetical protein IJH94_04600, partial [Clostridia bacterium]|nr:hypothetical protein [Clostridia bacterium]